jgi:type II secretory ATPase GspE/PulE/Tfp pilus assembly ATPase PilB-like protein
MSASEIGYFVMSVLHTRDAGGVITTVSDLFRPLKAR